MLQTIYSILVKPRTLVGLVITKSLGVTVSFFCIALVNINPPLAHQETQARKCAEMLGDTARLSCFDKLALEHSNPKTKSTSHRIVGGYCYEPESWKNKPSGWVKPKGRFAIAEIAKKQSELNHESWNIKWANSGWDSGTSLKANWIYPEPPNICRCSQMHASIQEYLDGTDCYISIAPKCDERVKSLEENAKQKPDARVFFAYQCKKPYSALN